MTTSTTLTTEQRAALRRLRAAQRAEARRVQRIVAWAYGYTPAQLQGRSRPAALAEARQVAMYLIRAGLCWPTAAGNRPFPAARIGALLCRDHATVLHGIAVIARRQETDAPLRRLLHDLQARLDHAYEGAAAGDESTAAA